MVTAINSKEVEKETEVKTKSIDKFGFSKTIDFVAFFILFSFAFILPLVMNFSSSGVATGAIKMSIFLAVTILVFILWLFARLGDGRVIFPRGLILWSSASLFLVFILSAGLSSRPLDAFIDNGIQISTVSTVILLFALMFLTAIYFSVGKRVALFYKALTVSFILVSAVEAAHIFTGFDFLQGGAVSNLIGKWNDMGIFFGLMVVLFMSILEFGLLKSAKVRALGYLALVISLLGVFLVNFNLAWILVGAFSLLIFIYSSFNVFYDMESFSPKLFFRLIPRRISLWTIALSVLAIVFAGQIGKFLLSNGISQIEVRPNLSTTTSLFNQVLGSAPVFGLGPNSFGRIWVANRPLSVNQTQFWNTDFNIGVGLLPTFAVSMGVLGLLAWVFFLVSLVILVLRALFSEESKGRGNSHLVSHPHLVSAFGVLYLWTVSLAYVPGITTLILTYLLTGIFLAGLIQRKELKVVSFHFSKNREFGFLVVLLMILMIISSVSVGYILYNKVSAVFNYQRGVNFFQTLGDIDKAEGLLLKSTASDSRDTYYRTLSSISIARINRLLQRSDIPKDELLNEFRNYLSAASDRARIAKEWDDTNYLNHMALGGVGEAVLPIGSIAGSYELARDSYIKAQELNPNNPSIPLALARIEIIKKDFDAAEGYLNVALSKKPDFVDAHFILSQLEVARGNLKEASIKADDALLLAPNHLGILFQSGLLKYLSEDYAGAVVPLERAISINSQFSNARYFLGISYGRIGRITDAIMQFENILKFNPGNNEVEKIINNLKAGGDPLNGVVSPEEREDLPLEE